MHQGAGYRELRSPARVAVGQSLVVRLAREGRSWRFWPNSRRGRCSAPPGSRPPTGCGCQDEGGAVSWRAPTLAAMLAAALDGLAEQTGFCGVVRVDPVDTVEIDRASGTPITHIKSR